MSRLKVFARFPLAGSRVVAIGLFASFAALYLRMGMSWFGASPWLNDELFEIDAARVAAWMTQPDALHLRTRVHPIYVLLVNPLGLGLEALLGSSRWAVQMLTAFFAAGAVAGAYLAVLRWKRDSWLALGVACLFGLSASQLVLGVVPDTSGLATLGLALAVGLYFRDRDKGSPSFGLWVAVGVLALGVTTTNVVAPLCLLFFLSLGLSEAEPGVARLSALRNVVGVAVVVLVVTAGLSLLQQEIYPNTKLFFQAQLLQHEIQKFSSLTVLAQPALVLSEVAKHFLLVSAVAPLPHEIWIHERRAVTFVHSFDFAFFAGLAALGWGALGLCSALRYRAQNRADKALLYACGCALAFQLAMHCFYGVAERGKMEFFLYTGNAGLLVILMVASGLRAHERSSRVGISVLVVLFALAGFDMLDRIAWTLGRAL